MTRQGEDIPDAAGRIRERQDLNICHFGDCRDTMRRLIAEGVKVQMCVTSPPYFGLRDFGHPGQLGLEATPTEYVAHMVEVFGLVRELLADDGVLWLNIGDSYAGSWGNYGGQNRSAGKQRAVVSGSRVPNPAWDERTKFLPPAAKGFPGIKPKDLIGIPWMIAFALRADGWYLRQDIIWHKPNPMPESVTDRCTKAHEYIFLMSKSPRYYFDAEAIKEQASYNTHERQSRATIDHKSAPDAMKNGIRPRSAYKTPDGWDTSKGAGGHGSFHKNGREKGHLPGNKTHKGTTAYEAGAEEHRTKAGLVKYAEKARSARDSFKRDDSKRAIAIPGQSVGIHRPDRTESEWDTAKRNKRDVWTVATQPYSEAHFATFPPALIETCIIAGSRPGDIVLDPFLGSGTTGQVAQVLGRNWIGCEINEQYKPLQERRTAQTGMIF